MGSGRIDIGLRGVMRRTEERRRDEMEKEAKAGEGGQGIGGGRGVADRGGAGRDSGGPKALPTEITARELEEMILIELGACNQSDRTCFRRIAEWTVKEMAAGRQRSWFWKDVVNSARDSKGVGIRNPRGAFVARMKRELGYVVGGGRD